MDADVAAISLHRAIAAAARSGANYHWIVGVLAGCLATETTTTAARAVAIRTLTRPPVRPARPRAA
jgi:hypothetical protein